MDNFKDTIEEIKAQNDISQVISQYVHLKPSGNNFLGICPFHKEKTPSFSVNTSKQSYHCFGCGTSGDVINFIMDIENLEFMDAVKLLADRCGIEIATDIDEATKKKIEKIKKYQEIHKQAARYYFNYLFNINNSGFKYLISRGLDERTIKKFGLGFAPESWNSLRDYLINIGYNENELFDCGLINKSQNGNYYDRFRNRVLFPIFDYRGSVIGFGGRVMDDSKPKYLNSPDTIVFNKRYNLYGLNFARKNIIDKTLILVEGYMDLISLYQYNIKNVIATLGTAITKEQASLIKRYANNVIVAYDSDDAGIKAALRAIDILKSVDLNIKILNLKEYKDPDEYIRANGTVKFKENLKRAESATRFQLIVMANKYDLSIEESKLAYLKEASKLLKKLKSSLEINYHIKYLSELTNIKSEIIEIEIFGKNYVKQSISKTTKRNFKNQSKSSFFNVEKMKPVENAKIKSEILLIKLILLDSDFRNNVKLMMDESDFTLKESKLIFNNLLKTHILGDIDVLDIDKSMLSEQYIKKLNDINLNEFNVNKNNAIIKDMINKQIKYAAQERVNFLLEEQKRLNLIRNDFEKEQKIEKVKEVELEIMKIALEIINKNRKIRSL